MINNFIKKSQQLLLLAFLFYSVNCKAQTNLIPNYSFELVDSFPSPFNELCWGGRMHLAKPWNSPVTNFAEIFHTDAPSTSSCLAPLFSGLAYQCPRTGKKMVGMWFNDFNKGADYRDYIQVPFADTLKANNCYIVYFYVNLFSDYTACNNIAISISDTALPAGPYGGTQYFHDLVQLPSHIMKQGNPVITDTMNWTPIAGIYQAHGSEKYAIISNFHSDSLTDTILINQSYPGYGSGYLIDDVFVIEAGAYAGKDTTIAKGDSVYLGIEQVPGVQNNWYVGSSLIKQNTGGIWVQPQQTTTYVLQSTICNTTYYDTVTVIVSNVGINQLTNNNRQLEVYPNPANTNLTIVNQQSLVKTIEVYDVVGRKLEDLKMSRLENAIQIEVSDLSSGIYFIKATDEKGFVHTAKFVKE